MDLEGVNVLDGQRLAVVSDGLTLWHGAQHAIYTTLAPGWAPPGHFGLMPFCSNLCCSRAGDMFGFLLLVSCMCAAPGWV